MKTEFKYWMVHCYDSQRASAPTVRHYTLAEATNEAKRLAGLYHTHTFFVLEAVTAFGVEQPKVVEFSVERAPEGAVRTA